MPPKLQLVSVQLRPPQLRRVSRVSPSIPSSLILKTELLKTERRQTPSLVLLFLLFLTVPTAAAAADKKVLFLYGDKSNGVMVGYREVLQSAMRAGSPDRITFYEEYMDLSQYPGDEYVSLLRGFYRQKYQGQKFDLVFAQAPAVLNFLSKYGEELFPGTPTVFGTLDKDRFVDVKLGSNTTGVLGDFAIGQGLEAALQIQPNLRHAIVVSGTSPADARYLAKAKMQFHAFEGRVEFTYLADLPMEELEKRVAKLPADTSVFFITIYRDGAGQSFSQMDAIARLAQAASVPVYCHTDRFLEVGCTGGLVFSLEADAKEVAKVALRVLAGEKPADIPIRVADTNRYMFDWRQLRRWNIDARRLPPGSIVLYRVPSFWETYKWRVVAVSVLCLLEALLILWLLINRKRIRRGQQAVQHLSGRLLMLQDEERQRVAAELHDGLGQNLAIIKNRAMLGLRDQTDHARAREQLEEIAATATASIIEVREIAHNLRPYELDRLGLVAAIQSMIERVSDSTTIELSANLERIDGLLSPEAETSVYRIVQEGVNNVIKHSKATAARIEIRKFHNQLAITVHDNGAGISSPVTTNGNSAKGFGLVGIAERVRVLGGSLAVDSQPSRGTAIKINLELANGRRE
jgi:signal transduction histidine kinase